MKTNPTYTILQAYTFRFKLDFRYSAMQNNLGQQRVVISKVCKFMKQKLISLIYNKKIYSKYSYKKYKKLPNCPKSKMKRAQCRTLLEGLWSTGLKRTQKEGGIMVGKSQNYSKLEKFTQMLPNYIARMSIQVN